MKTPHSRDYFNALQRILQLQTDVLTNVLPHSGERGSNDEEHFKAFLRRTLPHRFSIGTGFMLCSDPDVLPSRQTDIVIFDEFVNSPLFRELAASVFPIEIVYAAIEVKRVLQSKDVMGCLESIALVRRLAKHKRYIDYAYEERQGESKRVLSSVELHSTVAPRTFVVAYNTEYGSIESLHDAWVKGLSVNPDAHLHGCVVLSKNWYLAQLAFMPEPMLLQYDDEALVRFLSSVLTGISSLPMKLANMDKYFGLDFAPSPLDTDPLSEES